MANFYCKWCGNKYFSVSSLTSGSCSKNPEEKNTVFMKAPKNHNRYVMLWKQIFKPFQFMFRIMFKMSHQKTPTGTVKQQSYARFHILNV